MSGAYCKRKWRAKYFFLIIHGSSSGRALSRGGAGNSEFRIMQKPGRVWVAVDYIRVGRKKSPLQISGVVKPPRCERKFA